MEKGICIFLISIFLSNGKIYFIIPHSIAEIPSIGLLPNQQNVSFKANYCILHWYSNV